MQCPSCGSPNRQGRRFCGSCGAPLILACPACGFANEPDERYCGGCGAPLDAAPVPATTPAAEPATAVGDRRRVTVLFADLAGFTRLTSELDAEEVHRLLERFFATADGIVQRFGGHVDKHIGDCVMAVFGAPVAHDNDPERAVRAALAIRAAMPELGAAVGREVGVHIGIAAGEVVAAGTGSAARREYTITGETVNLAARLTDRAETGEILLSAAVHGALAERLRAEAVGELELAGIPRPVAVWRLSDLDERPGMERAGLFVGRRAELGRLEELLDRCLATGTGTAVVIRGEPGIGKSRLAQEAAWRASIKGFACHLGYVLDFGTGEGRDAVRRLVRSLLGIGPDADTAARQAALARALADGLADPAHEVFLNDLLSLAPPARLRSVYDAMGDAARVRGRQEALAGLVRRVSERWPLLLLVEDLHWADARLLDSIGHLAETVAQARAVLLTTTRPDGSGAAEAIRARAQDGSCLVLDLGPLPSDEARRLAGAMALDDQGMVARCVERAGGNPLFLQQLLHDARERPEDVVPGSVQSLVQARLDRLAPLDRHAVQAASVLGQRFALAALRAVIGRPDYDAAEPIRRQLLRLDGEEAVFTHALVRDAVGASLLKSRARELHATAAAWFQDRDPTLWAEHLDLADDPRAPVAYLEAGRRQAAAYRDEAARRLAERGLAIARQPADRVALACLLGEVLHDLGRSDESLAAYETALAAAADDAERCRARLGIAAVLRMKDRLDEALANLAQAEAEASRAGLLVERSRLHHLRGNLLFPIGRTEACLTEHAAALRLAQEAGSRVEEARALGGLGDAEYARGRYRTAHAHFSRCVELAEQLGLGRIEVANRSMVAWTRCLTGPLEGATAEIEAAIAAAARVSHHRAEIIARHAATVCSLWRLRPEEARRHIDRAEALTERIGARRFHSENLMFLAEAERIEGHPERALALLEPAFEEAQQLAPYYLGPAIGGCLFRVLPDSDRRAAVLRTAEELLRGTSLRHNHRLFHATMIDAALDHGDWAMAAEHAARLEAAFAAESSACIDLLVARGRALAVWGRGERHEARRAELVRLADEARRTGYLFLVPALEQALGAAG